MIQHSSFLVHLFVFFSYLFLSLSLLSISLSIIIHTDHFWNYISLLSFHFSSFIFTSINLNFLFLTSCHTMYHIYHTTPFHLGFTSLARERVCLAAEAWWRTQMSADGTSICTQRWGRLFPHFYHWSVPNLHKSKRSYYWVISLS